MNNQNANTSLLQTQFDFTLIDSDFEIWKYRYVYKDDTLIVLREMDLLKDVVPIADGDEAAVTMGVVIAAAVPSTIAAYWEIRKQAENEFKSTGKIKGFELLNPRTFDKLWISHYDMKVLEEQV